MSDIVTPQNEDKWRIQFAKDVGHTYDCVYETVFDMSELFRKVCKAFDIEDSIEEILETIPVECFDKHLREILDSKECNCKKEIEIHKSIKPQTAKN